MSQKGEPQSQAEKLGVWSGRREESSTDRCLYLGRQYSKQDTKAICYALQRTTTNMEEGDPFWEISSHKIQRLTNPKPAGWGPRQAAVPMWVPGLQSPIPAQESSTFVFFNCLDQLHPVKQSHWCYSLVIMLEINGIQKSPYSNSPCELGDNQTTPWPNTQMSHLEQPRQHLRVTRWEQTSHLSFYLLSVGGVGNTASGLTTHNTVT